VTSKITERIAIKFSIGVHTLIGYTIPYLHIQIYRLHAMG